MLTLIIRAEGLIPRRLRRNTRGDAEKATNF